MYDTYNIENPDAIIKIVEDHKQKKLALQDYEDAVKRSTNPSMVRFERRQKQKDNTYKRALIVTALVTSLALGAFGGLWLKEDTENRNAIDMSTQMLAQVVDEHTHYNEEDLRSQIWWYDIPEMAKQLLTEENGFDIDTKIYGCYKNFNTYNKNEHMDQLFWNLKSLVDASPQSYSEQVQRACSHSSFDSYLNSLGLTKEEYSKYMENVLASYGKANSNRFETEALIGGIENLSGGSR